MKLWKFYFLKRVASFYFFLLFCLFGVYVFIDLSINGGRFLSVGSAKPLDFLQYYTRHFAVYLDIFSALSFLLSSLKTLFDANVHMEITALQMAGISRKHLLLPFFYFSFFLTLVGYANHEWFAPNAGMGTQKFKYSHLKPKKKMRGFYLQSTILDDNSELVYQTMDPEKEELFDLFWIRSFDDLWTMKTLQLSSLPPVGTYVDHLVREEGKLKKKESFERKVFDDLALSHEIASALFIPFENRALSILARESLFATADQASIRSHFFRKLTLPLLPALALFAVAPFALVFGRMRSIFLIVALSLFGYIFLLTLFDSLLILGENQVLPPLTMFLPIFFLLAGFAHFFRKL